MVQSGFKWFYELVDFYPKTKFMGGGGCRVCARAGSMGTGGQVGGALGLEHRDCVPYLNFDQLVARLSQSRFSRRKVSTEVPACM